MTSDELATLISKAVEMAVTPLHARVVALGKGQALAALIGELESTIVLLKARIGDLEIEARERAKQS